MPTSTCADKNEINNKQMAAVITLHISAQILQIKATKTQNNRTKRPAPIFLQWSQEFWSVG